MLVATLLAVAVIATTQPATNVGATGATLNGTVEEATTANFEYGTTTNYGLTTPVVANPPDGPVTANITGLTVDTTYHYRLVASDGTDVAQGQDQTFRTAGPPSISNQVSSAVTPTSARVTSSVNTKNIETGYRIQWGSSTSFGNLTPNVTASNGTVTASVDLTDLKPSTTYYWRTRATNAAGTRLGSRKSFKTGPLPTAITVNLSHSAVTWGGSTTLGGRVSGSGVGGLTLALEQQRPQDSGFVELKTARTGGDGGYLFMVDNVWANTRYRVVTRTPVPVTSPVVSVKSKVKVGAKARHSSRRWARVEGSILPAVDATVTLQRKRSGAGWQRVKRRLVGPADNLRSRYSFAVPRARRAAKRFRVLVQPVSGSGNARGLSRSVVVKRR